MRHSIPTSVVALLLAHTSWAQGDHLVRLDTSSLNFLSVGKGLPTADGGSVLQLLEPGGFTLWKCDADGQAQWRNKYPSDGQMFSWDIAPTTSGDVLFVFTGDSSSGPGNSPVLYCDVRRIAQDGTVNWHKRMELDPITTGSSIGVQQVQVTENGQSDIFITCSAGLSSSNLLSVTKLEGGGEVLWSRRIGDATAMMSFPFPSFGINTVYLAPDPFGGCRIVAPATDFNDESVNVVSLAADGSLSWARLFDYLGLVSSFKMSGPAVTNDGSTVFCTHTTSDNGGAHLVRISESGQLVEVQQVAGEYWGELRNDQGDLLMLWGGSVITLSEAGDPLIQISFGALPDGEDSTYFLQYNHMEVANGRACFAGSFIATPTGAGLPVASAAVSSFDLNSLSCGRVATTLMTDHVILPNSIFTCAPMANIASDTLLMNTSNGPLLFDERTLFGTTDLCVYTAIEPIVEAAPAFSLNRTLLGTGDALFAQSSEPISIVLRDAKGSLLWQNDRPDRRIDIPTSSLAPGLYLLTGQDAFDVTMGVVKVAVER